MKIIMFIRNQNTWLLSLYSQYLKGGGLLSLHDFIECQLNNMNLDAHYIDWYPLIKYLYGVFGQDNVLVCLYEDLKESPQKNADEIFSFLNIPSCVINPEKVNPSLSRYGLALRRFLNHFIRFDCGASSYSFHRDLNESEPSPYSSFMHKFAFSYYKPITNRLCIEFDNILRLNRKLSLNETQLEKVKERYGASNLLLSELLDVDLSDYDYPLL